MFRTLIYPSSGACDCSFELPHLSYCSWFDVCWSFGVVGLEWYPYCRLQVIQQSSRKLLMMDILMSETCWAHKKWNKIVSDIKLAFYSSTITMMHGPINIRFSYVNVYHTILSRSISCLMPLYFTPFRFNASSKPNPFIRLLFFFAVKRNLASCTLTANIWAQIKTNFRQ